MICSVAVDDEGEAPDRRGAYGLDGVAMVAALAGQPGTLCLQVGVGCAVLSYQRKCGYRVAVRGVYMGWRRRGRSRRVWVLPRWTCTGRFGCRDGGLDGRLDGRRQAAAAAMAQRRRRAGCYTEETGRRREDGDGSSRRWGPERRTGVGWVSIWAANAGQRAAKDAVEDKSQTTAAQREEETREATQEDRQQGEKRRDELLQQLEAYERPGVMLR